MNSFSSRYIITLKVGPPRMRCGHRGRNIKDNDDMGRIEGQGFDCPGYG